MILSTLYKGSSCSHLPKSYNNKDMVKVQRLSHGMRVKPQANGGRTILGLYIHYIQIDK